MQRETYIRILISALTCVPVPVPVHLKRKFFCTEKNKALTTGTANTDILLAPHLTQAGHL